MLRYPTIDPVALELGPLQIHWYGLMYLLGFRSEEHTSELQSQ